MANLELESRRLENRKLEETRAPISSPLDRLDARHVIIDLRDHFTTEQIANGRLQGWMPKAKSLVERSLAAVALIALCLPLVVVALIIRFTSPGPFLFRQRRVGLHGKTFEVFKFRTMVDGAHDAIEEIIDLNEHDGVLFKIKNDPRCTRVGKVLRRYSVDEIPQLINVVRGEMSLIGPRPALPSEVAQWGTGVARRLLVKPGLTGLWQVSGRSTLNWEESVALDLKYVEEWSPLLDLQILIRTIPAVLSTKGAY